MKAFVAGLTGNTGGVVAAELLEAGHEVRALARTPNKSSAWTDRGVEIVAGELTDKTTLTMAMTGVDAAYLLLPPIWGAKDLFAANEPVIASILDAVSASKVPRIVLLSSVGVHLEHGTGPIRSLRPLEAGLADHADTTFLRAAYFHQNLGASIQPVVEQGVLPVFFNPTRRMEMVSTGDIGRVAARLLQKKDAPRVVNLAGPTDHSMAEVAEIFADIVGKPVAVSEAPADAITPILNGMGAGHYATLYAEMNTAVDKGVLVFERPPEIERGSVTLRESLTQMMNA